MLTLRRTFATRLSAGGVADNFVTQMLRQGDAQVFKRYSQAKLNMMREASKSSTGRLMSTGRILEHRSRISDLWNTFGTLDAKNWLEIMVRFFRMNELGGTPGVILTPDPLLRRQPDLFPLFQYLLSLLWFPPFRGICSRS